MTPVTAHVPHAPDPPAHPARRTDGRWLLAGLVGGALAWTTHLFVAYLIVALWCATGWRGQGVAIGVLTLLCAAGAIASAAAAFRQWRLGQGELLRDPEPGGPESWDARMGERGARGVFLAVLALFLDVLFAYLIVLEALPPIFAPACPVWTMP